MVMTRAASALAAVKQKIPSEVIVHVASYISDRKAWNGTVILNKTIYNKTKHLLPPWPDRFQMKLEGTTVELFAMSQNGEWIVCGGVDGSIRFYNCRKGHIHTGWEPHLYISMKFSPTDPNVLLSMTDTRLTKWDLRGNVPTATLLRERSLYDMPIFGITNATHSHEPIRFDISQDGKLIVLELRTFLSVAGTTVSRFELNRKTLSVFPLADTATELHRWDTTLFQASEGVVDVKFLPSGDGRYRLVGFVSTEVVGYPMVVWG